MEPSWKERLKEEFDKPYFEELITFVREEYRTHTVYPPGPLIFNAFARVNQEFWSDYVQLEGIARCLHTLSQFTELIEAGEGDVAAALLREGLDRFRAALCQ